MAQILGADWVNLSVIQDFSTNTKMFEIHLVILLDDDATAAEVERQLVAARDSGNMHAPTLKRTLRALANADATVRSRKDTNERRSRRQIINAIMVRPRPMVARKSAKR